MKKEPDAVEATVESMIRDGFGETPLFEFFTVEDETESVVGISLYYWRYSTWKGKRLYLEDLIVTESARGKGYGKALFERTMAHAVEHDCTGMMWQVLDWNEPAIDFYRSYQSKLDGEWVNCSMTRDQMRKVVEQRTG